MKKNNLQWVAAVAVVVAGLVIPPMSASVTAQKAVVNKAIAKVAVPELSAKASALVTQAAKQDKEDTAVAAVELILNKYPGLASSLVSAISKAAPEVAVATAVKAAELTPDQASIIARAAAKNAPKFAAKIVAALSKVVPNSATEIAQAVIEAVPAQAAEVAKVVSLPRTFGQSADSVSGPSITQRSTPINAASTAFSSRSQPNNTTGSEQPGADYSRPQ